jgi:putative spermidine/putrescine transport system substrate-binding protein
MTKHNTTRKIRLRALSVVLASVAILGACGSDDEATVDTATIESSIETDDTTVTPSTDAVETAACPEQTIIDAAVEEGQVNLIALPDNWANYKGILQAFRDKYPGVNNPVANPDASSADELTAVKTLAGQPDMPDALDVSPAIAQQVADEGLWAPYKPCAWDEIPDNLKDPNGNWVAAYYGIMAIGTNTTIVKDGAPKSFADLKDSKYKGQISLNGDPREAGAAFAAVMAASLANGGSFDDILPGIEYFAELKKLGNLTGTDVTEASVISGETPIWLDWTYNYPGLAPTLEENGITWEINVPTDGVYSGYYAQGAVKDSPNPNAAQLWIDHIISDEGALGYIEGGAVPARYEALVAAGKVTDELKKNMPAPELLSQVAFPTQDQIAAAKDVLAAQWGTLVAD